MNDSHLPSLIDRSPDWVQRNDRIEYTIFSVPILSYPIIAYHITSVRVSAVCICGGEEESAMNISYPLVSFLCLLYQHQHSKTKHSKARKYHLLPYHSTELHYTTLTDRCDATHLQSNRHKTSPSPRCSSVMCCAVL